MADHHEHHHHSHATPAEITSAYRIAVALNIAIVLAEAIAGLIGHSLALVADAGHNLTDVLALLIAWGAQRIALSPPTAGRTYGFRRSTILASLVNALILLVAMGAITWEALHRFAAPQELHGNIVAFVAGGAIGVNGVCAWLFSRGNRRDVNVRGAFLHMASDAAVSAGVLVSTILIGLTGWLWLDPMMTLIIVAVITIGTWDLLRESINLAMDAVPRNLNVAEVRDYLASLEGVTEVHDLHVWGMSTTETVLTAHLVIPEFTSEDAFFDRVSDELHHRFDIDHTTLQIERGDPEYACHLAPAEVV